MKLDVLVIGAHPDDVELCCGGTVIKLVKSGKKVGLVDLTGGELGTRGNAEIRSREAAEAAGILGVEVRENLRIADGNVEANAENRANLIRHIRAYRPDLLIFPYSIDRHPDHEHAHTLCRQAWFQAGLEKVETLQEGRQQQAYRPRAYFNFMQWYEFAPSFIVDITEQYDQRMKAALAFRSQLHDPTSQEPQTLLSNPDFLEMLTTRFAYYGHKIGRRYGEPFFSPNAIGVRNLEDLIY